MNGHWAKTRSWNRTSPLHDSNASLLAFLPRQKSGLFCPFQGYWGITARAIQTGKRTPKSRIETERKGVVRYHGWRDERNQNNICGAPQTVPGRRVNSGWRVGRRSWWTFGSWTSPTGRSAPWRILQKDERSADLFIWQQQMSRFFT